MADELEQIEARLAAYIDGALPPDQQAEIETYLDANPTHSRLIVELKSIKTAITALPRDKAPPEVLDTLQAHLERHTLLEGVEETAVSSRINRWPQFGAVAAMLLLTAGLGLLVYQVLPRGRPGSSELAMLASTRPADADTNFGEDVLGATGGGGGVNGLRADRTATESPTTRPAVDTTARRDPPAAQVAMSPAPMQQRAARPEAAPKAEAITANTPAEKQSAADSDAPASPALADAVRVLVVTSDDPALTRNVLVASLAAEGTPFEITLPPATPTATLTAPAPTDHPASTFADVAKAAGRGAGPATSPAAKDASSVDRAVADGAAANWTVAALAGRLQAAGDLPADALADAAGDAVRPVVVRNVAPWRVDALRNALDHQRPGRQTVREQAGPVRRVLPTTTPTTLPDAGVAAASSRATQPSNRFDALASGNISSDTARSRSTTGPATAPAALAALAAADDLVVFIVAAPPVPTRPTAATPAASSPASRPSTVPADAAR